MADPDPLDFAIDLTDVRARLEGMGYFLSVTDALDASEVFDETLPASPPAAFVAVATERAEPNKLIGGGHRQRVKVRLAVLFAESASRAYRGGTKDTLERTRKAVIRILLGWKPNGAEKGFEYAGYRVVQIGDGLAWGEVMVDTSYFVST